MVLSCQLEVSFVVVGNSLRRALELEKRRREEAARDKKHLEPTQKSSGY